VIASSVGFSISAIPDGWLESGCGAQGAPPNNNKKRTDPFDDGFLYAGALTAVRIHSDTGNTADLDDGILVIESIEITSREGVLENLLKVMDKAIPVAEYKSDAHVIRTALLQDPGGFLSYNQTHLFSDSRTGPANQMYVVPNSGYSLKQTVKLDKSGNWTLVTTKTPAAVTVHGRKSAAGRTNTGGTLSNTVKWKPTD